MQEDIPFKVLGAGNEPDFRTISHFHRMKQKLKTKAAKAVYAARKCAVEPCSGRQAGTWIPTVFATRKRESKGSGHCSI